MRSTSTLALTAAVGVVGIALAPAATADAPDDSVAYLAAQIEAGDGRLTTESGGQTFDDLGLTIDAVASMSAAGSGGDVSATATDYLVDNAAGYVGSGDEVYSAATAKMLTFASVRGLDPRDVSGVDLVAQLQGLEEDGQFVDRSEYGDYSNTLGQAFGLIGLERAGVNPSTASVDALLAQQCDDGGFTLEFGGDCVSDPDATSTAVQALETVGGHDDAVQDAADFLEGRQEPDGGVGGGATTEAANANSTGLAAIAFDIAGRDDARAAALGYVESLTFDCDTPAIAGAIAYDKSEFDTLTAEGEDAAATGTSTRATAQALLGVAGESWGTVTAEGQSAATPTPDCEGSAPTPGDDAGSDDDATGDDASSGNDASSGAGDSPEIPAVVQTDGGAAGGSSGLLALGAGGLAAVVTLALRRRGAEQRH